MSLNTNRNGKDNGWKQIALINSSK